MGAPENLEDEMDLLDGLDNINFEDDEIDQAIEEGDEWGFPDDDAFDEEGEEEDETSDTENDSLDEEDETLDEEDDSAIDSGSGILPADEDFDFSFNTESQLEEAINQQESSIEEDGADTGNESGANTGESTGDEEEQLDSLDYTDGAIVEGLDLHDEEEEAHSDTTINSDFISPTGNIVVQDVSSDTEDGFEIKYINIEQIAITNRIRKMESVDALVQSIKSTGLLEPLVVANTMTEDLYILLSGYRRIQACARAGKTRVPCIINTKVSTPEIPILEAMYNHQKRYSMKEQIDYIDYLEKEKGIMNPAMIEYLLQMNNGDYTKLKDILSDGDDDIITKLYDGLYDIATAFKKLEARRKKESREEKENKLADSVYGDEEESGVNQIEGSGEEVDDVPLTDEQIQALAINMENFEDDANNLDLTETVAEDDKLEGFEDHKQKVGERECLDPAIRKAALIRDRGVCQCCKLGGPQMVNNLDAHHVVPVSLGGADNVDNTIMLCLNCHRSVHMYATKDLTIDKALYKDSFDELDEESKILYQNEQIFENLKLTYKKIVYLGGQIRKGMVQKGINREQYKKDHPNHEVGRRMPGKNGVQTTA